MRKARRNSIQSLVLAAVLSIGLGFGPRAFALTTSFLIDLNSKMVTRLGT
jgi:hypothetical protein